MYNDSTFVRYVTQAAFIRHTRVLLRAEIHGRPRGPLRGGEIRDRAGLGSYRRFEFSRTTLRRGRTRGGKGETCCAAGGRERGPRETEGIRGRTLDAYDRHRLCRYDRASA